MTQKAITLFVLIAKQYSGYKLTPNEPTKGRLIERPFVNCMRSTYAASYLNHHR